MGRQVGQLLPALCLFSFSTIVRCAFRRCVAFLNAASLRELNKSAANLEYALDCFASSAANFRSAVVIGSVLFLFKVCDRISDLLLSDVAEALRPPAHVLYVLHARGSAHLSAQPVPVWHIPARIPIYNRNLRAKVVVVFHFQCEPVFCA